MVSEMCIRDRADGRLRADVLEHSRVRVSGASSDGQPGRIGSVEVCLLYTSDAADDLHCVDLGGRRILKKKKPHAPSKSLECPAHNLRLTQQHHPPQTFQLTLET